MITKNDIHASIRYYEQEQPTIENCKILASLYTCLDHFVDNTEKELTEIIPAYKKYAEIKKKFQLHEISEEILLNSAKIVCRETIEFLELLYRCSDTEREREVFKSLENTRF